MMEERLEFAPVFPKWKQGVFMRKKEREIRN